jgi:hypothetical protein
MVYLAYEQAALTQNSQWNKHFTPPSPFPRQPISACLLCLYEKCFIFRTGLSNLELFLYTFHRIFPPHLSTKFFLCWPYIYRVFKQKDFFGFFCNVSYSTLLHLPHLSIASSAAPRIPLCRRMQDQTQGYIFTNFFHPLAVHSPALLKIFLTCWLF